jgi:hypothetical protein
MFCIPKVYDLFFFCLLVRFDMNPKNEVSNFFCAEKKCLISNRKIKCLKFRKRTVKDKYPNNLGTWRVHQCVGGLALI